MAAADRRQLAQRFLPTDDHVETLLSVLLRGARRGHELDVLQPVLVRVAKREFPEGVQTGVTMLARRVSVRVGRRSGRGPGRPPGPDRRVPVGAHVQRQRHVPRDAAAHVCGDAVQPDYGHHRLHRTRPGRKYTQTHTCARNNRRLHVSSVFGTKSFFYEYTFMLRWPMLRYDKYVLEK